MKDRLRHSYREDPAVPLFDDARPLVIFDSMCVLCSSGVQWMLARDPKGETRFCAIQHPLAQAIYAHYGLDAERFDTFMVLADGKAHIKWKGVLAAAEILSLPWRWLGRAGRIIPSFIGDPIYDWVQKNRIGWFGARAFCLPPDPSLEHRFIRPYRQLVGR